MTAIFNMRFVQPRRDFLKAGAALTLGVILAPKVFAQAAGPGRAGGEVVAKAALEPNAFVRIGADNTVTVVVKHIEMGQGTYTGLPTLVAEELDADWSQIRVQGAPADAKRYNNLFWGPAQGTGGSTAIANSYEQLRKAGAAARAMLVSAAAQRWSVPPESVSVSKGVVLHTASGRKATFGELAESASKLPVPEDAKLKEAKDFVYIGKRVPRTDSRAKTIGAAQYTQDVKLPGMLTAVVLHAPRFGAKVKSFNAAKASSCVSPEALIFASKKVAMKSSPFGWMTTENGWMTSNGSGANVVTGTTAGSAGQVAAVRRETFTLAVRLERFVVFTLVCVTIS